VFEQIVRLDAWLLDLAAIYLGKVLPNGIQGINFHTYESSVIYKIASSFQSLLRHKFAKPECHIAMCRFEGLGKTTT